jgi:hypothetical protein
VICCNRNDRVFLINDFHRIAPNARINSRREMSISC